MSKNNNSYRMTLRLTPDQYEKLTYWADRYGLSANEYMQEALIEKINNEYHNYDLPRAEIARLNQLVDIVTSLSSNVKSLEDVVISGFDSLLGLTRGDNYLLDDEDGDIS